MIKADKYYFIFKDLKPIDFKISEVWNYSSDINTTILNLGVEEESKSAELIDLEENTQRHPYYYCMSKKEVFEDEYVIKVKKITSIYNFIDCLVICFFFKNQITSVCFWVNNEWVDFYQVQTFVMIIENI